MSIKAIFYKSITFYWMKTRKKNYEGEGILFLIWLILHTKKNYKKLPLTLKDKSQVLSKFDGKDN